MTAGEQTTNCVISYLNDTAIQCNILDRFAVGWNVISVHIRGKGGLTKIFIIL